MITIRTAANTTTYIYIYIYYDIYSFTMYVHMNSDNTDIQWTELLTNLTPSITSSLFQINSFNTAMYSLQRSLIHLPGASTFTFFPLLIGTIVVGSCHQCWLCRRFVDHQQLSIQYSLFPAGQASCRIIVELFAPQDLCLIQHEVAWF